MDKVYRILDWLELDQAVDWLQDLTGTPVTKSELFQLCDAKQCAAYVDVSGMHSDEFGFDTGTAKGIHLVTNPIQAFGGEWGPREIWTMGDTYTQTGASLLFSDFPPWRRGPIFQPSDIQALAAKMNEGSNQPTPAEIQDLRDQLKKACESKENAWYLTDKYKAELEMLRETAEQDRSSREAASLRAEEAERQVDGLTHQLARLEAKADHFQDGFDRCKVEVTKLSDALSQEQIARQYADSLALELRDELEDEHHARLAERIERTENYNCACEQPEAVAQASTGITFPYATKQLEAMRDAAIKHWSGHDRSKPAPYGIQKTVASFLSARIGDNQRKLPELAGAIKPDDLPKG